MRLTFIIIALSILGCQNHNKNSESKVVSASILNPANDKIESKELIPVKVTEYLKNNLPGWNFPDTSDYIKCWWSFYDRNQIPYFITTDFNDDNLSDYAFILKNSNSIRLVILIGTGNTFTHWIADDFKVTYSDKVKDIQFGLNIEPPGRTDCVVDNKECSLLLQSNGIALMELEQKFKIYYWSNGAFKTFRVKS